MNPRTMNLRARLLTAFCAVLLLTLLLAGWSAWQLHALKRSTDAVAENWLPSIEASADMGIELGNLRTTYLRLSYAQDAEHRRQYIAEQAKSRAAFDVSLKRYLPLVDTEEERQLSQKLLQAVQRYEQDADTLVRLLEAGRADEALQLNAGTMRQHGWEVRDTLQAIVDLNRTGSNAEAQLAQQTYDKALTSTAVAAALAVVLGLVLAWRLAADLSRRVGRAAAAADRFAAGDLSHAIEVEGSDEVAQMLQALARMQQQLAGLVLDVRHNAESVATASAQISAGNADLSVRTENQASALQQTAASMEEINGTAQNNADNAVQASQLATQAAEIADTGSHVVDEVVRTMREIEQASRQVGDIISVIDGIAFQTNILALNAAVEAARAGEQGRGFAVVAGEVRALAQRSAEAARQVKRLIAQSVERVDAGATLVDQAGRTMLELKSSVQRVHQVVGEISAGSREQMSGVSQISAAVTHMDQATQQNAALVEESAAAAESLRQQAQTLVQAVSIFLVARAAQPAASMASALPAVTARLPQPARTTTPALRPAPAFVQRPAGRSRGTTPPPTDGDGSWDTF